MTETLDVVNCQVPRTNKQAIKSLVMPDERKELIEALVQKYSASRTEDGAIGPWRADHMENKGEGQIFLLHGAPGVGKTFVSLLPSHLRQYIALGANRVRSCRRLRASAASSPALIGSTTLTSQRVHCRVYRQGSSVAYSWGYRGRRRTFGSEPHQMVQFG